MKFVQTWNKEHWKKWDKNITLVFLILSKDTKIGWTMEDSLRFPNKIANVKLHCIIPGTTEVSRSHSRLEKIAI